MAATLVQHAENSGTVATLTVTLGATPTVGNLLVAHANSNDVVNTPTGITGWTAGPSVVDGNGTYIWYKVVASGDGTAVNFPNNTGTAQVCCAGALEYSGLTASPFDVSGTSTIANVASTSTTSVSVTTTGANGDLVLAVAALHNTSGGALPSSPTWTGSLTNVASVGSTGAITNEVQTFVGAFNQTTAGAISTACSWTNASKDDQELVIAFKLAAAGATFVRPTVVVPNFARQRASSW